MPVADVARATRVYGSLGSRLDAAVTVGSDVRVVPCTEFETIMQQAGTTSFAAIDAKTFARLSIPRRWSRRTLDAGGPPRALPPPAGAACSPATRGGTRPGQVPPAGGRLPRGFYTHFQGNSIRVKGCGVGRVVDLHFTPLCAMLLTASEGERHGTHPRAVSPLS